MTEESNFIKKDPITSYGILLYYIDENNDIWYLLAQRRDTIEYADYLRGRYSYLNLETYFSLMTLEERERLLNYSFSDLWDDLWVNHNNKFYKDIYPRALTKYNSQYQQMINMLNKTNSVVIEPGWGFPKGKKNYKELEVQCAIREFKEETCMHIDYLNLINLSPCIEIFKGTNGKLYSTVYYIARADHKLEITKKMIKDGIRSETVSDEISNLSWCKIQDALKKLPPWRQKLLLDAERKIREYTKM